MKLREQMRATGNVITSETAAAAEQFNDEMNVLRNTLGGLRLEIASELLPIIVDVAARIREWAGENRELITQRVAGWIHDAIDVARRSLPVLESMSNILRLIADHWRLLVGLIIAKQTISAILTIRDLGREASDAGFSMRGLALAGTGIGVALTASTAIVAHFERRLRELRRSSEELNDFIDRASRRGFGEISGEELRRQRERASATVERERKRFEARKKEAEGKGGPPMAAEKTLMLLGVLPERVKPSRAALTGAESVLANVEAEIAKREEASLHERAGVGERVSRGFERARAARAAREAGKAARRPPGVSRAPRAKKTETPEDARKELEQILIDAQGGKIAPGTRVPKVTAPVVTVTVNQTNVDVDVNSPISIQGVADMNLEQLATRITERQGNVLDDAVRQAIESIQLEAAR
jgi:hypothetical protein